jgi:hypothetical protein
MVRAVIDDLGRHYGSRLSGNWLGALKAAESEIIGLYDAALSAETKESFIRNKRDMRALVERTIAPYRSAA